MCSASTGTGGQSGCLALHDVVPPHVAAGLHGHGQRPRRGGARRGHASTVEVRSRASSAADLRSTGRAPAPAAVGGDEQRGLGVLDAAGQGLGREAAEDDRVRRADARAGEHGDGQLRDHGHVDGDPVAGLDAQLEEGVGGLLDLAVEVGVGEACACRRAPRSSGRRPCRRGRPRRGDRGSSRRR